jgi:hypothetical protein
LKAVFQKSAASHCAVREYKYISSRKILAETKSDMPPDPEYAKVRELVLKGKIKTIDGFFAVVPLRKVARDLGIKEENLLTLILDIRQIELYQIDLISEITGIPPTVVRNMVLSKVESLMASPTDMDDLIKMQ